MAHEQSKKQILESLRAANLITDVTTSPQLVSPNIEKPQTEDALKTMLYNANKLDESDFKDSHTSSISKSVNKHIIIGQLQKANMVKDEEDEEDEEKIPISDISKDDMLALLQKANMVKDEKDEEDSSTSSDDRSSQSSALQATFGAFNNNMQRNRHLKKTGAIISKNSAKRTTFGAIHEWRNQTNNERRLREVGNKVSKNSAENITRNVLSKWTSKTRDAKDAREALADPKYIAVRAVE